MPKSDIPMGSEFGPNQVSLAEVLELVQENVGDRDTFVKAVARKYNWPIKTANNTFLSMRKYLLLDEDEDLQLTEVGQRLFDLRQQPDNLHIEFARHILIYLHGLDVVNVIDTILKAGEKPTQLTISESLSTQGIHTSRSSTHISKLCDWLRLVGVFETGRGFDSLDMSRVAQIVGADQKETDFLADMPTKQRTILKALCNLPMEAVPDEKPLLANHVREYAEALYGVEFNPKNFPGDVLEPLATAGYIVIKKAEKATGEEAYSRTQVSGKPYLIYRTEKFANEYLNDLIDALTNTGLAVRHLLRKPLTEILDELESDNTNVKGKALEALAFYLMRLLGLEFKSWRERAKENSGFELDVIVEGARLIFSRWQIQCKNTPASAVPLTEIAKEVGLSLKLKSNVILIVTTGKFTKDALEYADDMMRITALNIVTLDHHDLAVLKQSPLEIVDILNKKARRVMALKA